MTTRPRSLPPPAHALLHPLWLGALALLVVNDHLLKGLWPGALTGKLSDVAGMVVAPPLFAVLLAGLGARGRGALAGAHLAVGVVFAAIKLDAGAAAAFESLMALGPWPWHITVDPSDLVALPALALSWRLAIRASRPRGRALTTLAFGAGLVASAATSPPPSELVPGFNTSLVVGGDVDQSMIVRVRLLRDSVRLDCGAIFRDPSEALAPELFAEAKAWQLEPDRVVPIIDGQTQDAPCTAALIDGTLLRGGTQTGRPIPAVLVFWLGGRFPPTSISSELASVPADRLLEVRVVNGAVGWAPHQAIFPAPSALAPTPVPGCEPSDGGQRVDWELPVPLGEHTLTSIDSTPDGCHRVAFSGGETPWYLCTGGALPFGGGDRVTISTQRVGQAFEPIDGLQLLGDGDAAGKRVVLARGPDLANWGDGDWTTRDEPECDGARDTCGGWVIPQRLTVHVDAGGTATSHEVSSGDALAVAGGTLVVLRAERLAVADLACGPADLAIDSVFITPALEP